VRPHPRAADPVRQARHTLTLEGLGSSLEALCAQAAQAAWADATVWAPVLRAERTAREARRLAVAPTMARVPLHQTLAPCAEAFQPRVEQRRLQARASCRVVAGGANGLWWGPPGVGQTPLAMGLGIQARQAGLSPALVSGPARLDLIGHEAPRGQGLTRVQPWGKPTRLSVDERGDLPLERPSATCRLPVVATRDAQGAMLLSRHQSCRAWGELCTDQVVATARLDRLRQHSTILHRRGPHDRLKDTRQAGVFPRPETLEAATAPACARSPPRSSW